MAKFLIFILFFGGLSFDNSCLANSFVQIKNGRFEKENKNYFFVGSNLWYGMNLGSVGPSGDRARLLRELDRLVAIGVTNLRILAASEGPDEEAWRMAPALQVARGAYNETLFVGLDFLLDEMKKRHLTAVVCLNNFWPWSGGMAQYLQWSLGGKIPYPPPQVGGSWETYQKYTAQFYSHPVAIETFRLLIRTILSRKNTISNLRYIEDPTIMAWQLANEPRGINNVPAFQNWIDETAAFIKSLDKNHLVTVGSEGETPWPDSNGMNFVKNHSSKNIDYTTAHIWVQNWGMYDPANSEGTFAAAVTYMKNYLRDHMTKATTLGKPLVLEEFGISRDGNSHSPFSRVRVRDLYYREVFAVVAESAAKGQALQGVNFWAWAGEGVPVEPYGGFWKKDLPFIGDPPHETQGWYSVYESDVSTISVIREFAEKISRL